MSASKKIVQQKTRKLLYIVGACVITLAVLLVGLVWYEGSSSAPSENPKMEQYLAKKYGQQFVVTGAKHEGAGIGVEGEIVAKASPVTDKTLTFEVWTSSAGSNDEYPGAVWARQETEPVRQFLKTVFNPLPEYKVGIHTAYTLKGQVTGSIPDFKTAQSRYGAGIVYGITVKMNGDLNSANRSEHADKAYQIIEYLKNKQVGHPDLRYVINIDKQDARYICDVSNESLEKVQSADDLLQCFAKATGRE